MNSNEKLKLDDGIAWVDEHKFKSMVWELLYLTHMLLDIMFVVSTVSRFLSKSSMQYQGAVNHILRYIAYTQGLGVFYTKSNDFKLVEYTDSDWDGSTND